MVVMIAALMDLVLIMERPTNLLVQMKTMAAIPHRLLLEQVKRLDQTDPREDLVAAALLMEKLEEMVLQEDLMAALLVQREMQVVVEVMDLQPATLVRMMDQELSRAIFLVDLVVAILEGLTVLVAEVMV
jgi:hypothetical protein